MIFVPPTTRMIYMSCYLGDGEREHARLHAGEAFLHKPFTPKALAAKIRNLLDS